VNISKFLRAAKVALGMKQTIHAVDSVGDSMELICMCCSSMIRVTESVHGMYCHSDKHVNIFLIGSHDGQLFLYRRLLCRERCEKDRRVPSSPTLLQSNQHCNLGICGCGPYGILSATITHLRVHRIRLYRNWHHRCL